jgi:hypothetical protein
MTSITRRLNLTDRALLVELVNTKSTITGMSPLALSSALHYRLRWIEGMEKHYLPEKDTHDLYGYFDDGVLVSCMGWRSDLPAPWDDSWVVGNLKARPGYSIRKNGILQLWQKMFEVCETKGLKRWHMIIPENGRNRYQAVADRYFKEIDSTYDYEWSIIVPPNKKPEEDWVWGSMGRQRLNTEIRVRTGTKKCVQT